MSAPSGGPWRATDEDDRRPAVRLWLRARPHRADRDRHADFIEPGGFGAALGNDVAPLRRIVPTVGRLVDAFRIARLPIIYTRGCHKPDLSDCPPAKRLRGKPSLRIGDPGPMGRILVSGEPGAEILPELRPGG